MVRAGDAGAAEGTVFASRWFWEEACAAGRKGGVEEGVVVGISFGMVGVRLRGYVGGCGAGGKVGRDVGGGYEGQGEE